jgi:hypothetical protein
MNMELTILITICILLPVGPAMSYNYGSPFFLHRGPDGDVVDTDFANFWAKLEANQTKYIHKWSNMSLQEKCNVPEVRPAENYPI